MRPYQRLAKRVRRRVYLRLAKKAAAKVFNARMNGVMIATQGQSMITKIRSASFELEEHSFENKNEFNANKRLKMVDVKVETTKAAMPFLTEMHEALREFRRFMVKAG